MAEGTRKVRAGGRSVRLGARTRRTRGEYGLSAVTLTGANARTGRAAQAAAGMGSRNVTVTRTRGRNSRISSIRYNTTRSAGTRVGHAVRENLRRRRRNRTSS